MNFIKIYKIKVQLNYIVFLPTQKNQYTYVYPNKF